MLEEASFEVFIELVKKLEGIGYRPQTQYCEDVNQVVTDWIHPMGFAVNVAARIYLGAHGPQYCVASLADRPLLWPTGS